eukprot:gene14023-biopygen3814
MCHAIGPWIRSPPHTLSGRTMRSEWDDPLCSSLHCLWLHTDLKNYTTTLLPCSAPTLWRKIGREARDKMRGHEPPPKFRRKVVKIPRKTDSTLKRRKQKDRKERRKKKVEEEEEPSPSLPPLPPSPSPPT